jgi:hypothetical protein
VKLLTTYSEWLVIGALKKKLRYESTGPNVYSSIVILVKSSPKITMSIINGVARRESSQMLYVEIVLTPFIKIVLEYSSRALFES